MTSVFQVLSTPVFKKPKIRKSQASVNLVGGLNAIIWNFSGVSEGLDYSISNLFVITPTFPIT